jgi:tRNA (adenine22-N1)-methyltransferase
MEPEVSVMGTVSPTATKQNSSAAAAGLREKPLEKARENAARFGVADRMDFIRADGLAGIEAGQVDTIVCAGMGGDLIRLILEPCAWVKSPEYALVLQPQSAGQDLRRYLTESGFRIEKETLVRDGGFLYTVLTARWGESPVLTPGEQYATPQLQSCRSPLLPEYLARIENALQDTVLSLQKAAQPEPEKFNYYRQALREITEMRGRYDNRR